MSKTISIAQWQKYLNKKTGGFKCPICHHTDWQTQQNSDGTVAETKILDQSFENYLYNQIGEAIVENGGTHEEIAAIDPQHGQRSESPSLLKSVNILRCGHCGWVALFDRKFVEEEIDG